MVALFLIFLAIFTTAAQGQLHAVAPLPSDGLSVRAAEPLEVIVADLQTFVPRYLQRQRVPGASIALIRDRKIAWTGGFGVLNSITREPVTPETLFEVASNSKVVTAYAALRLVDQGKLALDQPLNSYLAKPWLPPSTFRDVINLRHVLSHSSGLGQTGVNRNSLFAPGEGFRYSSAGIVYAQNVIEHVAGKSLEDVAREQVFLPLGMPSASYINRPDLTPRTSYGHIWALVPVVLFLVPCLAVLVVLAVLGLPVLRLWKGRWRPSRRALVATLGTADGLILGLTFFLFENANLREFAWLILMVNLVLIAAFAAAFWIGRFLVQRWCPKRVGLQIVWSTVWGLLVLGGLILLSVSVRNLPVPRWPAVKPEGAASLRATAGDMATFLIELSQPRRLSAPLAEQLRTPQVRVTKDLSWGLGPGILHGPQGDALWQWGQHVDFQSVMIIHLKQGFGAVVLTNSDLLNPDVALDIAQRAVGGNFDTIRRASHLEFRYRPPVR